MAVRPSDGKSLLFEFFKLGGQRCTSPVFEGGVVHKMGPKGLLTIGLGVPAGPWLHVAVAAIAVLLLVTIYNRARRALGEQE